MLFFDLLETLPCPCCGDKVCCHAALPYGLGTQVMTTAFKDKDTTFGLGVNIAGVNYEVHRFYPDEGIAWCCIALLVRSEG